jgi:hypothetical protein
MEYTKLKHVSAIGDFVEFEEHVEGLSFLINQLTEEVSVLR